MWWLAIETTSAHGSLALLDEAEVRASRDLAIGHYSTQLLAAMTALAAEAGLRLAEVNAFAVASGPGSFTGARVGLTTVKGLIEVWDRPAVAVSTLAAVAALAEGDGPVLAALDAARGEVYFGLYGARAAPGRAARACLAEGVESLDRFRQRIGAHAGAVVTPHATLQASCAEPSDAASLARVSLVPARLAAAVGRVGRERLASEGGTDALRLDANYVRRSDAEIFSRR